MRTAPRNSRNGCTRGPIRRWRAARFFHTRISARTIPTWGGCRTTRQDWASSIWRTSDFFSTGFDTVRKNSARRIGISGLALINCLAVCWRAGASRYLISDLGSPGGSYSEAMAINNSTWVAGSYGPTNSAFQRAFCFRNGTNSHLGTLGGIYAIAYGINNSNQIVGEASSAGIVPIHAFVYSVNAMTDLGTLGGTYSSARGINRFGQTVGESSITPAGNSATHAFV